MTISDLHYAPSCMESPLRELDRIFLELAQTEMVIETMQI